MVSDLVGFRLGYYNFDKVAVWFVVSDALFVVC